MASTNPPYPFEKMLWQLSLKAFSYEITPAYLSLLKEGSWRICLIGNIDLLDSERRPKKLAAKFLSTIYGDSNEQQPKPSATNYLNENSANIESDASF